MIIITLSFWLKILKDTISYANSLRGHGLGLMLRDVCVVCLLITEISKKLFFLIKGILQVVVLAWEVAFRDTYSNTLKQKILNIGMQQSVGAYICEDLFGEGNFYLELQPSHNPQQIFVNKQLLEISNELGIPYIITTDSHYLKKTDADIHEKYLNSQDGDREVKSFYASTYMMSTEELESYFPYLSPAQFETAYNNIRAIAAACQNYSIKRPLRIPHLPWLAYNHNVANIEFYLNKMPSLRKFLASKRSADPELVYAGY